MSGGDTITVERDGNLGWIRINRPERLNALGDSLREDLHDALLRSSEDDEVRVIVTDVSFDEPF